MEVKFETTNGGFAPQKTRDGDAAFDVRCPKSFAIAPKSCSTVPLGVRLSLPRGACALVIERSGHASKHSVFSIGGLIDPNYKGQIHAILYNGGDMWAHFSAGDRVAQILVVSLPSVDLIEGEIEDEGGTRGTSGLGSSGDR